MIAFRALALLLPLLGFPIVAAGVVPELPRDGFPDPLVVRQTYLQQGWTIPSRFADLSRSRQDGRMEFLGVMGTVPVANMQADGQLLPGSRISARGMPPHITRTVDATTGSERPVIRFELRPEHRRTAHSWRVQVADAAIDTYRHYAWVLVFKFDEAWNTDLPEQRGLIWQILGKPKPGQHGNPVIAFNLERDQLYCAILYPESAMHRRANEAVRWKQNQYVKVPLPRRIITPGRYHTLQLEMFSDDRPDGEGYFKAVLDGEPWIDYHGPTLHPDQLDRHVPAWGWYQWGGQPTEPRVIWWGLNHRYER